MISDLTVNEEDIENMLAGNMTDGIYLDYMNTLYLVPKMKEIRQHNTCINLYSFTCTETQVCTPRELLGGDADKMLHYFLENSSKETQRKEMLADFKRMKNGELHSLFFLLPFHVPGHFFSSVVELFLNEEDGSWYTVARIMDSILADGDSIHENRFPPLMEFLEFLFQFMEQENIPRPRVIIQPVKVLSQKYLDCAFHAMLNLEWFLDNFETFLSRGVSESTPCTIEYEVEQKKQIRNIQIAPACKPIPWFDDNYVDLRRLEVSNHAKSLLKKPITESTNADEKETLSKGMKRKHDDDDIEIPVKKQKIKDEEKEDAEEEKREEE